MLEPAFLKYSVDNEYSTFSNASRSSKEEKRTFLLATHANQEPSVLRSSVEKTVFEELSKSRKQVLVELLKYAESR